jgi:hypothetical protein
VRTVAVDPGGGRGHLAFVVRSLTGADARRIVPDSLSQVRAAVLADATAWRLHGETLRGWCVSAGIELAGVLEIPPGEGSKDLEQVAHLLDGLAALELERRDLVLSSTAASAARLPSTCARGRTWPGSSTSPPSPWRPSTCSTR